MMLLHHIAALLLLIAGTAIAFGFDGGAPSAAACPPKASRRGRAQLLAAIPCDLSEHQTYCNQPGSLYPWHAVRRFVHENQGLMKRMYGDVKHIAVLRGEMDRVNEIDGDDVADARERYSRAGWKKNKYLYSDYNFKGNDVLTEPYFRLTTTTTSTTTTTTTTSAPTSTPATSSTSTTTTDEPATPALKDNPSPTDKDTTLTPSVFENITQSAALVAAAPQRNQSEQLAATISTTLRIFPPAQQSAAVESASSAITPPQEYEDVDDDNDNDDNGPTTPATTTTKKSTPTTASSSAAASTLNTAATEDVVTLPSELLDNISKETTAKRGRPQQTVDATAPAALDGQFFQDVVQKEAQTGASGGIVQLPPNARGVNACPVKEEVVAPFWANNTRGEVLALLNLYPFEQYVHWEKCTNELKQMWCRDGCRCEQQFRLHRLLAYDPHNECRGIFSDWFRFPSCCICKCYDIPLEYRMTSRSPRDMFDDNVEKSADGALRAKRHPVDVAQETVKQAAYEHIVGAESWYQRRRALSVDEEEEELEAGDVQGTEEEDEGVDE